MCGVVVCVCVGGEWGVGGGGLGASTGGLSVEGGAGCWVTCVAVPGWVVGPGYRLSRHRA